ncbi:hypothetical protein [uncultured Rubinisphaera sp.]|uniref:hypothetical protein n=1 Tax=uncultured Rubinisphaera sp. TaxID=1678686 RepID=UPI0030D96DFA
MSRRSKYFLALVPLAIVSTYVAFELVESRRLPPEEIDSNTLRSVDETKLMPAVQKFIDLAQQYQTIGKPTSQFPDLWSNALPINPQDIGDRFRWYKFNLPMTADLRAENDAKIARREGVLYWPMLCVRVDTDESKIVRVAVFTQGF